MRRMKRFISWQAALGILLIIMSAVIYFVHYLIFKDAHHIFIYLVGDIAFVFLEVLLVTLVLHELLHRREKQTMFKKLNMVMGVFFTELGTDLLKIFSTFDPRAFEISDKLIVTVGWSEKEFAKAMVDIKKHGCDIDVNKGDLEAMKQLLVSKRQFLLNLIENPNLLEHESFTDLLWAVFHLTEELIHRKILTSLPDNDYKHLTGDTYRAYRLLVIEWLSYMEHLKSDYPYLFSLAVRTNPFNPAAEVQIK
jgi:hypothetical protein